MIPKQPAWGWSQSDDIKWGKGRMGWEQGRGRRSYNISPARDVSEVDARREALVVEPLEELVRENHACRAHRTQTGEIRNLPRGDAQLGQLEHPPGTYAQLRRLLLGGDADQDGRIGLEGRAVVEDDPSTTKQRRHIRQVHDPARRGVLQRHAVGVDAFV